MREVSVTVYGMPAPQGSKRHVGGGRMIESSAKVRPWRALVTAAAVDAAAACGWSPDPGTPLALEVTFTLPRPRAHFRTGAHDRELRFGAPTVPGVRPDLDKLLRSTLDALTDSGVISDDSRVVTITAAKVYPGPSFDHPDALEHPGAVLTLWAGR